MKSITNIVKIGLCCKMIRYRQILAFVYCVQDCSLNTSTGNRILLMGILLLPTLTMTHCTLFYVHLVLTNEVTKDNMNLNTQRDLAIYYKIYS